MRFVLFVLAVVLLGVSPLTAQLRIGSETQMNADGEVFFGYAGASTNYDGSSHGLDVGGNANINGSYFNPNFLSFSARPYYGRSQSNSDSQSISDSSGFDASVGIFGGSHFPGFISYGRSYNSTGTYGIPGVGGLVAHGDGQQFGVGWSALIPGLPPVSVSYSDQSGSSTIYGSDQKNQNWTRSLNVNTSYHWDGFQLQGAYLHLMNGGTIPAVLTGVGDDSNGSANSFQVSANHRLPLNGGFGIGFTRTDSSYSSHLQAPSDGSTENSSSSATIDNLNTQFTIQPFRKLFVSANANYTDNLFGNFFEDILSAGGAPPPALVSSTSHGLLLNANAFYTILPNFGVQGSVSHQRQYFDGQSFSATQFSGGTSATYMRPLFGSLTFYVGVNDSASQLGNNGVGLSASVSFGRKISGFDIGASYSYSQYVQTLVATSTTSAYGYGAHVSRKLNTRTYWNASYGGSHTGFGYSNSSNRSDSMTTGVSYRGYAANMAYSQSSGFFIITASGLSALPPGLPPEALPPSTLSLFDAKSLSVSLAATLMRRMTVSLAYARGDARSITPTLNATNQNRMLTGYLRYPLRKIFVTAGFTRFTQGISTAGQPGVVTSYNFGISRWFKFF